MTKDEAVNWIITLSNEIGRIEYKNLWHYEQALDEIKKIFQRDLEFKSNWISCDEKLPEPDVNVIMQCRAKKYPSGYRYFQTIGCHIPKYTIRSQDKWTDECGCEEYDEITDEYYCWEGWYEECTQGNGDNMSYYMDAKVIAWQPLPEIYRGDEN